MAYSRITSKYKLQSVGVGNVLEGPAEKRTAEIIDNQLFGSARAHSGGHGIIRTGEFTSVDNGDGTFTLQLLENKARSKPVVEAFINQIYVFTENGISWENLVPNVTYYVGVKLVESLNSSSLQFTDVQTWINTSAAVPTDGLLIASINIATGGLATIDEEPVNRYNIPIWGNHISDNSNPHGTLLNQDNLTVSGLNVLSSLKYNNLEVEHLIISGTQLISGNITVLGKLIVSGTITVQGNIRYNLLQTENMDIPGKFLVSELLVSSGMDVYPSPLFRQNIRLASGITIDGFDPSEATPLIDGSNADHLHGHVLGSLAVGVKPIFFSPEYSDTVTSGHTTSGYFYARRLFNRNFYDWNAVQSGIAAIPVTRVILPQDFDRLDRISITHAVGLNGLISGNNTTVKVYDKDFRELAVTNNGFLQSTEIISTDLAVSGGNVIPSQALTIMNRMCGASGVPTLLGDMTLWYVPKQGEKIIFDWNHSASGNDVISATKHFDGVRRAPADLRIERTLCACNIALSGASVFGINVGDSGSEPANVSTLKPVLSFGSLGASYQGADVLEPTSITIRQGQLISATSDLIASGTHSVNLSLVTYRI